MDGEVKSMLTRQHVAQKLIYYLHHRISLTELVDWAAFNLPLPINGILFLLPGLQ